MCTMGIVFLGLHLSILRDCAVACGRILLWCLFFLPVVCFCLFFSSLLNEIVFFLYLLYAVSGIINISGQDKFLEIIILWCCCLCNAQFDSRGRE